MYTYNGYTSIMKLDSKTGKLIGKLGNTGDYISFQGANLPEFLQNFRIAADSYDEFRQLSGYAKERFTPDWS